MRTDAPSASFHLCTHSLVHAIHRAPHISPEGAKVCWEGAQATLQTAPWSSGTHSNAHSNQQDPLQQLQQGSALALALVTCVKNNCSPWGGRRRRSVTPVIFHIYGVISLGGQKKIAQHSAWASFQIGQGQSGVRRGHDSYRGNLQV